MTAPLGTLERVPLREVWKDEAADFTPWLASEAGLKLLGDAIGIELSRVAEEQPVGDFSADILARTVLDDGETLVVIENQLEQTDHKHLGQVVTYAAGLNAKVLVWVAKPFREQHRAAIDWLNENTGSAIACFGVEVELWRIGDSLPAPRLNVVSRPNEWRRAVAADAKASASPESLMQLRYWEAFNTVQRERGATATMAYRPSGHAAKSFACAAGSSIAVFYGRMNVAKRWLRAELVLQGPAAKAAFAVLAANKAAIGAEVGVPLEWEERPAGRTSSIAAYLHDVDASAEADWPRQHAWLADMLERFNTVFPPRLADIASSDRAPGEGGAPSGTEEQV
jgi:hypothetical protein